MISLSGVVHHLSVMHSHHLRGVRRVFREAMHRLSLHNTVEEAYSEAGEGDESL